MKTNFSRFSLDAYFDLLDASELSPKEEDVCDTVALYGPMTREEIESASGMRLASVCGRVNSLLKKGVPVETGEKRNPITGKANGLIDISLAERAAYTPPTDSKNEAVTQGQFDICQKVAA